MKIEFLGTRGYIDAQTPRHRKHSATRISYYDRAVIIDCGEDWLDEVHSWDAEAIVITHAHPDHAFGLKEGAPCPVFATEASWEKMENFAVKRRERMPQRHPIKDCGYDI